MEWSFNARRLASAFIALGLFYVWPLAMVRGGAVDLGSTTWQGHPTLIAAPLWWTSFVVASMDIYPTWLSPWKFGLIPMIAAYNLMFGAVLLWQLTARCKLWSTVSHELLFFFPLGPVFLAGSGRATLWRCWVTCLLLPAIYDWGFQFVYMCQHM
jgi:hypothetical protein